MIAYDKFSVWRKARRTESSARQTLRKSARCSMVVFVIVEAIACFLGMSQNTEIFTYFILDDVQNRVKIGKSRNVARRIKSLQTGNSNIFKLRCTTTSYSETELHKKFCRYKINGEWFTFSAEIKCFLIRVSTENANG